MPRSARKLNFMIREEIARDLEALVPSGERSRVVNEALARELLAIRRRGITERLRKNREQGPALGTRKILSILRKDRARKQGWENGSSSRTRRSS